MGTNSEASARNVVAVFVVAGTVGFALPADGRRKIVSVRTSCSRHSCNILAWSCETPLMLKMRSPTHIVRSPTAARTRFHVAAAVPGKMPSTFKTRSCSSCETFNPNELPSFRKVTVKTMDPSFAIAESGASAFSEATAGGSMPGGEEALAVATSLEAGSASARASARDNGRCSPWGSAGAAVWPYCCGGPNGNGITAGKVGPNCRYPGIFGTAAAAAAMAAAVATETMPLSPR
mmetsp:Transcript_42843/g.123862  ORF Transcript_42843/g.123862 Transcript_42843/m.123862 type:complete len:234 (-) Transcript_42843:409-1110(-)